MEILSHGIHTPGPMVKILLCTKGVFFFFLLSKKGGKEYTIYYRIYIIVSTSLLIINLCEWNMEF